MNIEELTQLQENLEKIAKMMKCDCVFCNALHANARLASHLHDVLQVMENDDDVDVEIFTMTLTFFHDVNFVGITLGEIGCMYDGQERHAEKETAVSADDDQMELPF